MCQLPFCHHPIGFQQKTPSRINNNNVTLHLAPNETNIVACIQEIERSLTSSLTVAQQPEI